ncbi:four helix bundle protein [Parafilimonas sp.]|uniref:four helix bundle protein n=1 Tax=Parafilimonas sp. TaxID=1969739 RepID=UPI0039E4C1AD
MKPHKTLEAWKQSFELVKDVYRITNVFPAEEKFGLVSQLRKAAVSVPTNIAEGAARKSKKEFIQFLYISEGSLSEIDTLLELSVALNFLSADLSASLFNSLENISKLIIGLIKKLESQQ